MKQSNILITKSCPGYELLDSGEGEKLERFGDFILSRPDPQALWRKHDAAAWKKADGHFKRDTAKNSENGGWAMKTTAPARWNIELGGLKFWIKPTPFKHVGLFPEQSVNWEWLRSVIQSHNPPSFSAEASKDTPFKKGNSKPLSESREVPLFKGGADQREVGDYASNIEILNLFGYTGGATLACAQAGAAVVHVDGSKSAIAWARENAELSGLEKKPVRWILDDARAFVRREVKRGRKYDGIIMDPPAFGHGPDNELWKIEEHFLPLIEECQSLLKDKSLFFLINGYSAGYSALAYENTLLKLKEKFGGSIEIGELTLEEKGSKRLLPAGIFARWSSK